MKISLLIIVTGLVSYCMAVSCTDEGFCWEFCLHDEDPVVSCINREIDFSMATAGSRLYCLDDDTCVNITLKCPDSPSSPSLANRYNCEIRGHNGIFQSRHNWHIYAPNSFTDLTITDFNVHVDGSMHCGTNYNSSCFMQYGLWNCNELENDCFVSKDNEQYIDCSGDEQCKGETKACEDVADGEDITTCNVICSGTESCSESIINCGLRTQCNVICTGEASCFGKETSTTINCPSASQDNYCSVLCGSSTATDSCNNVIINAVDLRGTLNITAMGAESLTNAVVYGPSLGDLNVECNAAQSCDNSTFFANNSDLIQIDCNDISGSASCQNINVYCPTNGANCVLDGTSSDTHSDLNIFAIGGWDDIDIKTRYKLNSVIDTDGESTMHCGSEHSYDASCLIQSDWFCECPPLPSNQPSASPTMSSNTTMLPTPAPHDDDGMDDQQKNGYIVGGVFVGFVVLCLFGLAIWFCFFRKKPEQQDDYEAVQNVDDGGENGNKTQKSDIELAQHEKNMKQDDVIEEEENRLKQEAPNGDIAPDQETFVRVHEEENKES